MASFGRDRESGVGMYDLPYCSVGAVCFLLCRSIILSVFVFLCLPYSFFLYFAVLGISASIVYVKMNKPYWVTFNTQLDYTVCMDAVCIRFLR